MKAVRFERYGGIEVLQVAEVPMPEPSHAEALVRVKAASINPGEAKIREGLMPVSYTHLDVYKRQLQGLHAEDDFAAGLGLGEVRHVGVHGAGRDGIYADPAGTQDRGEVLHQRVDGALRRRIGRQRADGSVRRERRDQHNACLLYTSRCV